MLAREVVAARFSEGREDTRHQSAKPRGAGRLPPARQTTNALDPRESSRRPKRILHEVATRNVPDRVIDAFAREFEPKWPMAVQRLTMDRDELLPFYDLPAEHWRHLRSTNPIVRSFAAVKLRTRVTKGAQWRQLDGRGAGDGLQAPRGRRQDRWRMFNGPEMANELLETTFKDGIKVTDDEDTRTHDG